MNQSLTPNISSHGRSRGGLKNLENLIALDHSRHIYGTVIWASKDVVESVRRAFCRHAGLSDRRLIADLDEQLRTQMLMDASLKWFED
jgi:hypothetical protein